MLDAIGRDPDYLELNKKFTIDIIRASFLISIVPPRLTTVCLAQLLHING